MAAIQNNDAVRRQQQVGSKGAENSRTNGTAVIAQGGAEEAKPQVMPPAEPWVM